MLPNAFIGYPKQPSDAELADALAATKPLWDQIVADLASEHKVDLQEWKCYSAKSGWSAKLKRGKRTILYLAPLAGCFQVMFILGDRAVAAAREGGLPKRVLKLLDEAQRYPEGTGVRFEVHGPKEIADIMRLARIKVEH
jgi:hypothetical protein